MAGLKLPIESHVLQAMVSEPVKPVLDTVVTSGAVHFYVSQSDKGELVMGGDLDFYNSYAQRGNLPIIEHVTAACLALFPSFGRLKLMRTWGGIMDMTMDGSPIIAKLPVPGLYMTGGWCYGGFKATPASGFLHAHTIAHDAPHPLNAAFTLERFEQGRDDRRKGRGPYAVAHDQAAAHVADPLPLVRTAQPDRIHLRRRRHGATSGQRCAESRRGSTYVYLRDNPMGPHDELWLHSGGCRSWFKVRRDTRTHDILASARIDEDARRDRQVTQAHRLPDGGIVDRTRTLRFEYDGVAYQGYAGDTLASALLANGIHLVGRSFKYHRPRGIFSAGTEEPNALVQLARGARTEPNVRATHARAVRRARRRQPELLAVGALRRRRDQQRAVAADSRRFLLQDVHVAAHAQVVAALRARDPSRGRHGPRRARTRSRPLRASVRALRRAGDRRRRRGSRGGARRGACRCARDRLR